MKPFVYRLLLIVAGLYIFLLSFHLLLDELSISYVPGNDPNNDWSYIKELDVDELYVGNSRTWVHVDINTILRKTNVKSYALAHDGGDMHILYLKLKKFLNHTDKPSRINLQFDNTIIKERNDLYGLEKYAPELYFNSSMKSSLEAKLGYSNYYYWIPLISYSPARIFKVLTQYKKDDDPSGFACQEKSWESLVPFNDTTHFEPFSYESSVYLDSIFELCKRKQIRINGIVPPLSPTYLNNQNLKFYEDLFIQLSDNYSNHGNFYNFSTSIDEPHYFYNHSHLNCDGAVLFTNILLAELYQ